MVLGSFFITSKDRMGMCYRYCEIFSNSDETLFVKIGLVKKNRQKTLSSKDCDGPISEVTLEEIYSLDYILLII
jgi:hypothetical protein